MPRRAIIICLSGGGGGKAFRRNGKEGKSANGWEEGKLKRIIYRYGGEGVYGPRSCSRPGMRPQGLICVANVE